MVLWWHIFPERVRNIKKIFSWGTLVLVLAFLAGGLVENQLRLIASAAGSLGGLLQFLTVQVSVLWAVALAVAGAGLMALAIRISGGRRGGVEPVRNYNLSDRVRNRRERTG